MRRLRGREPSENGSPRKGGCMGIGTRPRSKDTTEALRGSPKRGGTFGMGRRGSRGAYETLMVEKSSPKNGRTRLRLISGETTIAFENDVVFDSPKKGVSTD